VKLTKRGWPRPIFNGWPIPWVSPRENLSLIDGTRERIVQRFKICQVCGLGHEPGATVYIYCSKAPGEALDLSDDTKAAFAIDNAVMHERCARLAVARCPRLRSLQASGELAIFQTVIEAVAMKEPADGKGGERLAVASGDARLI
jgi:hypothetical protein